MNLKQELAKLNKEQLLSVQTTEGYIRVIAGAGSGKTRALTTRYAYLIEEKEAMSNRILCVTFTNKAANEMKSRVTNMIGNTGTPFIMTFHGFCNRFLREEIHNIGWNQKYKIIDTDADIPVVLKTVYEKIGITSKDVPYSVAINDIISNGCKSPNRLLIPNYEEIFEFSNSSDLEKRSLASSQLEYKILYGYLAEQVKDSLLDYEDLLNLTLYILKNKPIIREKWQQAFDYIQVDEFQDVSVRELELVSILSDKCNNLFVVGDGDQSIYSFRGSNVDCINKFEKYLSGFKGRKIDVQTIILNQNYRSTPEILDVSNSLIKHNTNRIKKDLNANRENGARVIHYHGKSVYDEAQWVVDKIMSLDYNYSDIAVLYRTHSLSKAIEDKLIEYGIPYRIVSGIGFYQRKEIKDIISILSLASFDDNLSFTRIIKELPLGIGKKKIEYIKLKSKEENISLYEALKRHSSDKELAKTKAAYLIDLIEYIRANSNTQKIYQLIDYIIMYLELEEEYGKLDEEQRYENVIELKRSAQRYESESNEECSIENYLNMISLYTNQDREDNADKVTLMTIHASKGLEFPVVFVIGLNEGILPSSKSRTPEDFEEERRIGYVALTRAKDLLFMTDAEGENYDKSIRIPSRYLINIDADLYDSNGDRDDYLFRKAKEIADSEDAFNNYIGLTDESETANDIKKIGDRVYHQDYGNGTVINIDSQGWIIMFDDMQIKGIAKGSKKLKKI